MRQTLLSVVIALLACCAARAGADTLTVSFGGTQETYAAAALLARPDAATITIPDDVSYKRPMTYRAVPLLALLGGKPDPTLDTLEARAGDGFVSQIPMSLVEMGARGGSVAWLAVEDAAQPWPPLPGKDVSAGRSISSGSIPNARRSAPSCGRTKPSPSRASNPRRTAGRRWPSTRRCLPAIPRGWGRACSPRNACRAIA